MRFRRIAAGLLCFALAISACTPAKKDATQTPSTSLGVPQHGDKPCPGIAQEPPSRGQRLVRGFLNVRNFPAPGAEGGNTSVFELGVQIECVLNAQGGWASSAIRFDLAGGPDNDLFHVVLLSKKDLHNKDFGGCQNPQDDSCAQINPGQPENQCFIVIEYNPDWKAIDRAGVIYHEVGHCFFGPDHETSGLMKARFSAADIKTARPSAPQKAAADKRALAQGPIFTAP